MYDLGNNPKRPKTLIPYKKGEPRGPTVGHNGGPTMTPDLDSDLAIALHHNLLGHYMRELDVQSSPRAERALDERFYDNDPWSDLEKAILKARGQNPTNFNVISTTINWMIGTERRNRTEYKVLPRRKDGSQPAERKSQLLKYLADTNNSEFSLSQAYAEALKTGLSWIESGWQGEGEGEPIYDRMESWRNILHDSLSRAPDYSDARYLFRMKWSDVDAAKALFPDRAAQIDLAKTSNLSLTGSLDLYGDEAADSAENAQNIMGMNTANAFNAAVRDRVRLIECWFRKPVPTTIISGGQFSGEIFDEDSPGHQEAVDMGEAVLDTRVRMRMHVAIFTTAGLLHFQESPYRHNRFPLTPIYCYRRASDGDPYGIIRNLRDLQTQINHSASKAQFILSTNKTIMEKGAVDNLEEFTQEVARPDAVLVVNPGKRLEINTDRELAPAHLDLMSRMIMMVQQTSGVTDESLGRTTNAVSGKAITARQDQGSLATTEPLDNLRLARKVHGEKMLSLLEQFMTEQKAFRITNSRGTPEYVTVNDELPENDITRTKADFVISEEAWNATSRAAQFDALLELAQALAPVAPQFLMLIADLLVDRSDLPNREEIVKRIRQMTGQKDPDADPNAPLSPEEQAQEAMKAEQAKLQMRGAVAEVAEKEASAAQKAAQALKTGVDAKVAAAGLPSANLDAVKNALETALAMLSVPQATPVADRLLASAGYQPPAPATPPQGAVPPGPVPPQPIAPVPQPQGVVPA